jgi:hypothetical protein
MICCAPAEASALTATGWMTAPRMPAQQRGQ